MFNFKAAGIASGLFTAGLLALVVVALSGMVSPISTMQQPIVLWLIICAAGLGWIATILCAHAHASHKVVD